MIQVVCFPFEYMLYIEMQFFTYLLPALQDFNHKIVSLYNT